MDEVVCVDIDRGDPISCADREIWAMAKKKKKRVVIVGGGFGGMEVAKSLDDLDDLEILLIDRANYHLFQPLLYQVAMAGLSPAEIASPIRGIIGSQKNIRVVLGEVTEVDLEEKKITIDNKDSSKQFTEEPYDWLVVAIGAQNSYFGHDEWEKFAPGLKSIEDALEIRRRVLLSFERAERITDPAERARLLTFAVIGGGPTGVEMCGAIAELAKYVLNDDFRSADPNKTKVVLVEAGPRILASFPEDLAQSAVEQLHELGVEVQTNSRVVSIDEQGVVLEGDDQDDVPGLGKGRDKKRIRAATVLWGAGVRANNLTKQLEAPLDKQGRVIVEQDCSVPNRPDVFVIGDAARFEEKGQVLPGVSPVAMQQGRYVARIIRWEKEAFAAGLGRPPRKGFWYLDKGSMATIGRSRAIAWARGIKMSGFIAWLAWLFIHIWYLIGFRNRIVTLFNWFWSYVSYKRGARLITSTGWTPSQSAGKKTSELAMRVVSASVPPPPTPQESKKHSEAHV
jgi:NADH:ubiquinone reductase (H+-translocating)